MRRSSKYHNEHEANVCHYDTRKSSRQFNQYSHAMSAVVIVGPWFWADGLGAIDVAGAVAPHPRQTLGNQLQSAKLLKSPPNDGHSSPATRRLASTKDGGCQSKGDSGTRCTFGDFSSLHSMSCWFSVPGLAQVGLDPFSARQGSRLTVLETRPITYERHNCAIIRFIMYIKTIP